MSEKWVPFQTDLILEKRKKSHVAKWGNMGGFPKLQCFFLQETDKYSGLCEQECYRDGAPLRWFPKGSASCHAPILRIGKESFYRRFVSTPRPNSESNRLQRDSLILRREKSTFMTSSQDRVNFVNCTYKITLFYYFNRLSQVHLYT